jgi:hypothetical protein
MSGMKIMNFHKLLFIVLLIFCLADNSFAQFQASVWGGVNSSSFGGNAPEDASYESIYGLTFGGNLDFQPTGDFVISLEPSFEQKGSNIVFGDEEKLRDTVLTYSIKQNYFGLGIIFKITTERFFVGSGVSFQLLSSAKVTFESTEKDIKDKFLDYDAVAFFNVGYKIPIGGPKLFIELRYIQGLVNIYNGEADVSQDIYISNYKSTGLKLTTGIMIPL